MRINADFSQRASYRADDSKWVHSPESGVDRQMLDRIGDEVARATSIVRYAPGSRFASHSHAKGEEFLVLEGVFSDESGDYPEGSYVRNPPGTSHAPHSEPGCQILVKLRQFAMDDLSPVAINWRDERRWPASSRELLLHEYDCERVSMLRIAAGDSLTLDAQDAGTELLTVSGQLRIGSERFSRRSWLRFPPGDDARLHAETETTLWRKSGHLGDLC